MFISVLRLLKFFDIELLTKEEIIQKIDRQIRKNYEEGEWERAVLSENMWG